MVLRPAGAALERNGDEEPVSLLEDRVAVVVLLPADAVLGEEKDEATISLLEEATVVEVPELGLLLSKVVVAATTGDEVVGGTLVPVSERESCGLGASFAVIVASPTLSRL